MAFFILQLGIVVICLCLEFGFFPFLNDTITVYRTCKDFLALAFAGLIPFFVFQNYSIPKQIWKWPGIILCFVMLHCYLVPQLIMGNPSDQIIVDLWKYRPLAYICIYYLFFLAVQALMRPLIYRERIVKTLMWVGLLSSIYIFLQALGLDDAQKPYNTDHVKSTTAAALTSFFTHPNYAGSFIALCVPFAMYFRKYWIACVMVIAVVLTQTLFAIVGMFAGVLFYIWFARGERGRFVVKLCIAVISIVCLYLLTTDYQIHDNGRFIVWKLMWEDLQKRPLFGYGLGSFNIVFNNFHPKVFFKEAHNEIYQFGYETGIVGSLLLISGIVDLLKMAISSFHNNEILICLTSSFVIITLSNLGQFGWQIEPHRFVSIVVLGSIIATLNKTGGIK